MTSWLDETPRINFPTCINKNDSTKHVLTWISWRKFVMQTVPDINTDMCTWTWSSFSRRANLQNGAFFSQNNTNSIPHVFQTFCSGICPNGPDILPNFEFPVLRWLFWGLLQTKHFWHSQKHWFTKSNLPILQTRNSYRFLYSKLLEDIIELLRRNNGNWGKSIFSQNTMSSGQFRSWWNTL